jgi:mannan endo-1,4-beta-mannosidase
MKLSSLITATAIWLLGMPVIDAYQSFAGSNLYYAAGLSSDQQDTLFSGLQSAGVKVLRVWLDGVFSP